MSDHTPGPWGPSMLKERPPREVRARIPGWLALAGYSTPETEANARLIAAAPELLTALEDIAHMGHDCPMTFSGSQEEWERHRANLMQRLARAAIAKARGTS